MNIASGLRTHKLHQLSPQLFIVLVTRHLVTNCSIEKNLLTLCKFKSFCTWCKDFPVWHCGLTNNKYIKSVKTATDTKQQEMMHPASQHIWINTNANFCVWRDKHRIFDNLFWKFTILSIPLWNCKQKYKINKIFQLKLAELKDCRINGVVQMSNLTEEVWMSSYWWYFSHFMQRSVEHACLISAAPPVIHTAAVVYT